MKIEKHIPFTVARACRAGAKKTRLAYSDRGSTFLSRATPDRAGARPYRVQRRIAQERGPYRA
jgi:hypothetical protein